MKKIDIIGYIIGFTVFIVLIPALMWWVSGSVKPWGIGTLRLAVCAIIGIGLGLWTNIYMKIVGKGHPMDPFNHEIGTRTSELMTDGPYKICRNPMLLGALIYYIGVLIFLHSWKAAVIFIAFFVIAMIQVKKEEQRLERDFGDSYREYKRRTAKIIPFIW